MKTGAADRGPSGRWVVALVLGSFFAGVGLQLVLAGVRRFWG